MPKLLKEITRLGDDSYTLSDILFYDSERSPRQYKQIRKHPICKLGMGYLKTNLPDVPFVVHCNDEEIKAITEAMFKKIWRKMIFESLEKLEFGFKCSEILYEVGKLSYELDEEEKEFEGILLRTPRGVDAETIAPNGILIHKDGDLRGFMQDNDSNRQVLVDDRKCLLFVNQYESGNWYGDSEYENVFQAWYDSNLNRQFGMRWLERKGTGHYVGRYPSGKTKIGGSETENADIMLTLLNSIMEGSTIALPSDRDENGEYKWDISLLNDEDKTNSFIEKDNSLDSRILRGLVIPEKALTQGEVGARASIEAFQDIFVQRKQDILDTSVEAVNEFLVPAFIIPNFGPDIDVRIEAGQLADDSKLKASEIISELVKKGVIEVDKNWLEKKSGVPFEVVEIEEEPEPEEEVIEDIEEELDEDGNPIEKDEEVVDEEKEKLADIKLATKRQENEIEKNYGLGDFGQTMESAEQVLIAALTENLTQQMNRIVSFLDKNSQDPKYINVADDIKIRQAPIKKIINEYGQQIYSGMFTNLEKGSGSTLNLAEPPKKFIGFRSSLSTNKLVTDLESELKFAVSQAMNNESSKAAVVNIPKTIFPAFIDKRIPTLAGTETGFFFNQAQDDFVRVNQKLVKSGKLPPEKEIERLIYSAILDDRTTELCTELDGTIAPVGSPIISQYNPPLHFNCRSTWLPLTKEQIANNPTELELTKGKNGKPVTVSEVTSDLGNTPINKKGTKTALDEITFKPGV